LEAGCGACWPLKLSGVNFSLTGIDLDEKAILNRIKKFKDIDDFIIGDLRDLRLPNHGFDIIYNAYVLEHIDQADKVLENFIKWLRPGGLLILKIPDRCSVYGFLSRVTPFCIHRAFVKIVQAKKDGFGPYPTYYHKVVSHFGINCFCQSNGLKILGEFCSNFYLNKGGVKSFFLRSLVNLMEKISMGRLAASHNNLLFIIENKQDV
jgi:ubiquinone/menaquinone biosynthesis C-methylase UbiE